MAEKSHWSAEPSSYRMSREHDDIWALIYDPTPGGRKNDDGTTTYSMRFPALVLSEYVEGPSKVAAGLARSLNSHDKLVEALKAARAQIAFWKATADAADGKANSMPFIEPSSYALAEIDAALASLDQEKPAQPVSEDNDCDDYYVPDESGYSRADEEWFFGMDGKP